LCTLDFIEPNTKWFVKLANLLSYSFTFNILKIFQGKNPTVEKEVITPPKTETATPDKSAQDKSATPVPDTTNSSSKTANNTDEPKATPDKTPKSVVSLVPDQNRPKAASRPRNTSSRISTESRNSGVNQGKKNYTMVMLLIFNVKILCRLKNY
jgi:hypothetical protein